jgi:hypothetical protein
MDQIDGPSLGEIFKPLAWDKTRTEGAKILQRLIDLPMPVVGEVNGPAIVHSEYLLLADVHIASERATYLSSAPGFQAPWSRPWPSLGRPAPVGETVTADNAVDRELVMKIPARELAIGDIFRINDWQFHVLAVEREVATAVRTAEFDFLLHFTSADLVDVQEPRATQSPRPWPRLNSRTRAWQPAAMPIAS